MRIVTTRNQQVARVDHERDEDVAGDVLATLLAHIGAAVDRSDVVVLSDYRKGVVTAPVIAAAAAAAAGRRIPLLVDPKVPVAERYRGASLITPNHQETELMTQMRIRTHDDARAAARHLHAQTGANVLITRGEHGMWILDASRDEAVETALPAAAREVADVTGAGDTVISVLAMALAAGAPLFDAARLANVAAGLSSPASARPSSAPENSPQPRRTCPSDVPTAFPAGRRDLGSLLPHRRPAARRHPLRERRPRLGALRRAVGPPRPGTAVALDRAAVVGTLATWRPALPRAPGRRLPAADALGALGVPGVQAAYIVGIGAGLASLCWSRGSSRASPRAPTDGPARCCCS